MLSVIFSGHQKKVVSGVFKEFSGEVKVVSGIKGICLGDSDVVIRCVPEIVISQSLKNGSTDGRGKV